MSISFTERPPGTESEAKEAKRRVRSSIGAQRLRDTIPGEDRVGWLTDAHYPYGRILVLTSRTGNGKDRIVANLSQEKPYQVTYEHIRYTRVANGRTAYEEVETSREPFTISDIIRYQDAGGELQEPFDKAARENASATQNFSILVSWYYLSWQSADVTGGDHVAFAGALKKTIKSINFSVVQDRGSRRSRAVDVTPIRPTERSAESDGIDNVDVSDPGVQIPPYGLHSRSPEPANVPNDTTDNCLTPTAPVSPLRKQSGRDDSPLAREDTLKRGTYALTSPTILDDRDQNVQIELQYALRKKGLLKYSENMVKDIKLLRDSHQGYEPCNIGLHDAEQSRIVARLEDKGYNREVHIFYQRSKDSSYTQQKGVSLPRSIQRKLRRPFSQAISLDAPLSQSGQHDGGDRLLLFCTYVFAVKGVLSWNAFGSQEREKLLSVLAFMEANDPLQERHQRQSIRELENDDTFPDADNEEFRVVGLLSSTSQVQRRKRNRMRTDRSPPPFVPLQSARISSRRSSFRDSALGSVYPSATPRSTTSPILRVQKGLQSRENAAALNRMGEAVACRESITIVDEETTIIESSPPRALGHDLTRCSIDASDIRRQKRKAAQIESPIYAHDTRSRDAGVFNRDRDEEEIQLNAEQASSTTAAKRSSIAARPGSVGAQTHSSQLLITLRQYEAQYKELEQKQEARDQEQKELSRQIKELKAQYEQLTADRNEDRRIQESLGDSITKLKAKLSKTPASSYQGLGSTKDPVNPFRAVSPITPRPHTREGP
ncbi:hypothetical protein OPT61_g498 [Boeremia exigua]|uniref:Uncharacterized protein n=1 Tax=Boeremia exigua TaxID=749465 RepID=A0ACC2ITN7_9PLEO|nr:hypothetical protein OPT61_g498 [Boeremia exigua]